MHYIPQSAEERKHMLRTLGLDDIGQLFRAVPPHLRLKERLNFPGGWSEQEVLSYLKDLASRNAAGDGYRIFLGGGAYEHYAPSHIDALISRSEFCTSYTPYQPEIAQGTLQAIFEFQTMICQLTGMEVANASMYDGSTALAEAVLMSLRITKRRKVLLAPSLHPHYREVTRTYARHLGAELCECAVDPDTGLFTTGTETIDSDTAAVVIQSPNFFGCIEDVEHWAEAAHLAGALLVVAISEPISLGLLRAPGDGGADIGVGAGQAFGIPVSFGGPYVGFFATWERFVRQMPGRLVGQALDAQGRRGFVLTMSTREQHIRREKATSNICTNQGLFALMATIYLATMGPQGLRELAEQNFHKARYVAEALSLKGSAKIRFRGPFFNEFVIQLAHPIQQVLDQARSKKIVAGIPLGEYYPELSDCILTCVTEVHSRSDLDELVTVLR